MRSERNFTFSTGLKIVLTTCFSVGSIFIGANGSMTVSLLAALAALAIGVMAAAEVSRNNRKTGFILGILASVLSALGTVFVLTSGTALTFTPTATVAAVPALFWIALAVVHRKAEDVES